MALFSLMFAFVVGRLSTRWKNVWYMIPTAALLTAFCFITTNRPAFTQVEHELSLSVQSVLLNFAVKVAYLTCVYSVGYASARLRNEEAR